MSYGEMKTFHNVKTFEKGLAKRLLCYKEVKHVCFKLQRFSKVMIFRVHGGSLCSTLMTLDCMVCF